MVWTFYLREGVQFHKGYGELTAEDVKFSLEKAADKTASSFAADYAALDKVEAIDPHTVRITFKRVIPSVLGILANYHGGYIVSKKAFLGEGRQVQIRSDRDGPLHAEKKYIPQRESGGGETPRLLQGKIETRPD